MTDTITLTWTGTSFQSNTYGTNYGLTGTNMTVNWGDGTTGTITANKKFTHTYSSSGTYTITITGNSITSLGKNCFRDCTGLKSITIPSSVTSIGNNCFERCADLTSITIPSSITNLGQNCFQNCTSLKNVAIPSSVTSLGSACFYSCTDLTSITIPSSVTSIDGICFAQCTSLTSIIFKGLTPPTVSSSTAWSNLPTTCKISVPGDGLSAYTSASNYPDSSVYTYIINIAGELCNRIYPIGSIYMSTNTDDPATLFGGTWTLIKDKFLLACGDTYSNGATGGEKEVTLTVDTMPSHNHWRYTAPFYSSQRDLSKCDIITLGGTSANIVTKSSNYTGGSQSHNNMPPYRTVFIWERTA